MSDSVQHHTKVVLIPGCLALLPEYASLRDPVADLRAAVDRAVSWLGEDVEIVAGEQGRRVARSVLAARSRTTNDGRRCVVVVGNGSACRTEKAPGSYHPHAEGYDEELRAALMEPCSEAIGPIGTDILARDVWADTAMMPALAELLEGGKLVDVYYDDSPYGVQYWVIGWAV